MKTKLVTLIFCLLFTSLKGFSQPFRNLGFEEANTSAAVFVGQDLMASPADLVPGWQVFRNETSLDLVGYNQASIPFFENSPGGPLIFNSDYEYPFGIEGPDPGLTPLRAVSRFEYMRRVVGRVSPRPFQSFNEGIFQSMLDSFITCPRAQEGSVNSK